MKKSLLVSHTPAATDSGYHNLLLIIWLLIGCVSVASPLFADMRSEHEALQLAEYYFASSSKIKRAPSAQPQALKHSWTAKRPDGKPAFYIFNRGEQSGFAIVSADDRAYEILGYSENGHLEEDAIPENMRVWLEEYSRNIGWLAAQDDSRDMPVNRLAMAEQQTSYTPVAPICKTNWDQGNPYNLNCPVDDGKTCYTGCVATAAAQVMKVHNHPATGNDSHSYQWHTLYGDSVLLSANFGNTTYQWDKMLNTYGYSATTEQKQAVATLMYHCGVACDMNYGTSESGANTRNMIYALTRYFNYDKAIRTLPKDYMGDEALLDSISKDLLLGQPLVFSARTYNDEGHAFVCDGMDADGMVHINWGWSGKSDGYFRLSAMNPKSQGAGGSVNNHPFVLKVTAYGNIKPDQNGAYDYTIVAENVTTATTRYGRYQNIKFRVDTLDNMSISAWEGSPAVKIYRNGTLYTTFVDANTQLALNPGWFYHHRNMQAQFSSLEEGNYEVVLAVTTSYDNDRIVPVYIKGIGEFRCQMTVTADSVFFTLPDKKWEEVTTPNPNDFVYKKLWGYYYPSKSDQSASAWKLQLATEHFYDSNAENEMCIMIQTYGLYPNSMVGTFMEDPVSKEGYVSATMYWGNLSDNIRIIMDSAEFSLVYHAATRSYLFHYHLKKSGTHYTGQVTLPASEVWAGLGERFGSHTQNETITLDNDLYTSISTTRASEIIRSQTEGWRSYIPYVVGGTVSALNNTPEQMLTYRNCRLYFSDGITPIYAYNTRWLGNSDYTTGYEIELGGEAAIIGHLLYYQGNTPEIERGYFCHYVAPVSPENIENIPGNDNAVRKLLQNNRILILRGGNKYTLQGQLLR